MTLRLKIIEELAGLPERTNRWQLFAPKDDKWRATEQDAEGGWRTAVPVNGLNTDTSGDRFPMSGYIDPSQDRNSPH